MRRRSKGWIGDRSGAAAVEFAFVAPILIVIYLGMADLTGGFMAQRRTEHVASSIGDLVAQSQAVTTADVTDIFSIGKVVMAPFPTATLQQRITSVTCDAKGVGHVDWSQASGMSAYAVGSVVALPAALATPNASVIKADVTYAYSSKVAWVLPSALNFKQTAYLKPRISAQVALN